MKIIFLSMVLLSFLYCDEIQRIEAIVKDISELRAENDKCRSELKDEKSKRVILIPEIDNESGSDKNKKDLLKKIDILEKQVEKQEKLLKAKETMIKNLTKVSKSSDKKTLTAPITCKETNSFPQLRMKEEYQEKIVTFKASAFVLNTQSIIYDAINGKKIDIWEKGTSFTSNKKAKNWILITGYFVNKKWVIAKKEMWLKKAQVSKK